MRCRLEVQKSIRSIVMSWKKKTGLGIRPVMLILRIGPSKGPMCHLRIWLDSSAKITLLRNNLSKLRRKKLSLRISSKEAVGLISPVLSQEENRLTKILPWQRANLRDKGLSLPKKMEGRPLKTEFYPKIIKKIVRKLFPRQINTMRNLLWKKKVLMFIHQNLPLLGQQKQSQEVSKGLLPLRRIMSLQHQLKTQRRFKK